MTSVASATATGAAASRLTLADGSEAILTANGNVKIEEQSASRVRLRQRTGGARYVVAHNPARDFLVTAEGVTIRVRGTVFSVTIGASAVEVAVERGRVEISDRYRTRDLVAGESLSIPSPSPDEQPGQDAQDGPAAEAPAPSLAPQAAIGRAAPAPRRLAIAAPAEAARPSASELLARADAARAAGRAADAAQALEAFLSEYPRERRIPAALFTLGRVETARGRLDAAAAAFERCAEARPDGPLADDALAEAAESWHAAGVAARARAAARAYLAQHPAGLHAVAMHGLAGR